MKRRAPLDADLPDSEKRHTLKLNSVVIGWSDLETVDPTLGRARGRFRPGLGYDLVQPVFQLYADAVSADGRTRDEAKLERYHRSRDALPLELFDSAGRRIATSAIHIVDHATQDSGPRERELDVLISDPAYWARRGGVQ